MAKMMTYGEANSVLESSLSPSNRCLSKAVAVNAGAATDPLAGYNDNRLVPANAITPAHVPTIEHYFVLSDGTYSTNPTIYVGMNDMSATWQTVLIIDGEVYITDEDMTSQDSKAYASVGEFRSSGCNIGSLIPYLQPGDSMWDSYDSQTGIFSHGVSFAHAGENVQGTLACSLTKNGITYGQPIIDGPATIYITFVRSDSPTPPTPTQQWTVTYLGHDGDTFATRTVNDGEAAPNIEIGYTTEDNYVLQNWIDLPASVTSDCTVSGNWVYTPPTPPTDIHVNVNVTSAIDDRIYIQNVYISTYNVSEMQVSFNGVVIDKNETTSRTDVEYQEAGTTITKVEVQYTAPGFNGRKEIPYRDWHCTNGRSLNEGDTLYITVNI